MPQPMDIGAVASRFCGEKGHYKSACENTRITNSQDEILEYRRREPRM